jgi:hypothetical protein
MSRRVGFLAAATVMTTLAGCGAASTGEVRATVAQLRAAVGSKDGVEICALLSDKAREDVTSSTGKPCDQGVIEELSSIPPAADVQVYGVQAIARSGTAATFLARYDDGWRVTSADCRRGERLQLYVCSVEGN